ncbi:MAG TPA: hypothetical protein VJZ75_02065 [Candidatus Bathyarchaeia archaeon]|nr:hypothetical protein [Candidatus Bathyarchaeia archaeon]
MKTIRNSIVCLLIVSVLLAPILSIVAGAITPLSAGTFPAGTLVVPMDDKQNDRVHVYGFIHEFLRTPSAQVARIIEPPDVSMQTALSPAGELYQGGPFLIDPALQPSVNSLLSNSTFAQVTVTQLTAPFTSNNIFFVRQATRILVIFGVFGRTDLTLTRMGISYTLVQPSDVEQNPSILNQYTLIVDDCPGWFGNPSSYAPARSASIQAVYNTIQSRVQAGNEVIYTDIALQDLNSTFPGYINLAPGGAGSWVSTVHNPPDGFSGEFPSQYYNPGPDANTIKVFTEGGGYVVSSIQPGHASDVRILTDTDKFGVPFRPAILAFYFPYGNGIVEGLAFHPYEQLFPTYADENGYYATYEMYGNKFVHGPQSDFFVNPTPTTITVNQGQSASYTISITSVGSFSSPIQLQATGTPPGSVGSFSPLTVTPPPGGTVSTLLTVPTSLITPLGSYTLTITASSTLPQITRSVTVTLIVRSAPTDFVLNANPRAPTPLIVRQGLCGNISVSVQSIGNFSSPVNLTLSSIPQRVTAQFIPNPVTPGQGGTVFSTLRLCPAANAQSGDNAMTIIGTGGSITHSVNILLRVPAAPAPPPASFNPWLFYLLLLLLFLGLGIGLFAIHMSRKSDGRRRPMALYVLPLPAVRCRYCNRLMPVSSVYCPYCGRPPAMILPGRPRVIREQRRSGSITGFALSLVSGILVLLNGAALLAPSFYRDWSSIFWWIPILGPNYVFMLGLIIGLTLILSSIIMVLRSGALAALLIFPFAVFSLIIGGGFLAGMVLGIVGGIIGVLKR